MAVRPASEPWLAVSGSRVSPGNPTPNRPWDISTRMMEMPRSPSIDTIRPRPERKELVGGILLGINESRNPVARVAVRSTRDEVYSGFRPTSSTEGNT